MTASHSVRYSVKRALAGAALALIGAGGMAAYGQSAGATQTTTTPSSSVTATVAPPVLQTVVVTGTLIARPAAETAEAMTIVQASAIKDQGITNVEEALNTLTNNVPAMNISSAVGPLSGGGTYANLRGLGNGCTLVLLDGQRLADNATTGNAVDLGGIPFSAIDNQVLREGASALYGSDAIAGVINSITKKNYQGGEIQLRATQRSFSAAGGVPNANHPGTGAATIVDANGSAWQPGFPTCTGNPFPACGVGE